MLIPTQPGSSADMSTRDYRDLRVWQRAVDLVEAVYRLTRHLPPDERFGLVAQMRRAAVSIAANIAEGNGRAHVREYVHHLSFAHGSLLELETLLTIVLRLGLTSVGSADATIQLTGEVGALLRALSRALTRRGSADSADASLSGVSRVPRPASPDSARPRRRP
jgi:four helix bundle protein